MGLQPRQGGVARIGAEYDGGCKGNMGNPLYRIKVLKNEWLPKLQEILSRMGNLAPMLKAIGEVGLRSIRENFERGGRPTPWKELAKSTIKARTRRGHWPGKILEERGVGGGLLGSINYQLEGSNKVTFSAVKEYAAIHNFGGTVHNPGTQSRGRALFFRKFRSGPRKGRTQFSRERGATMGMRIHIGPHDITIPKRSYMLLQDDDWQEIIRLGEDYLFRHEGKEG
jgi:phage virion morphogenesis protein